MLVRGYETAENKMISHTEILRFIDDYAATLPTERAPFVALRHFPRFIGEIYPKGESKMDSF